MAVRDYLAKIKASGGIMLPAGAGTGKVAISDASGNISWATSGPIKRRSDLFAWAVAEPAVAELPGIEIELQESEKIFLVAVRYRCSAGEGELEIKRNASGVTSLTALKAKSTEAKRDTANAGTPIELAGGDYFTLNVKSATGLKGLSVTLVCRSEA